MRPIPEPDPVATTAMVLSAMANPKRLLILKTIAEQEMSVGNLADQVGLSQSALSQHLAKLRENNLVEWRRDAQTVYYSTRLQVVAQLLRMVKELLGPPNADGRDLAVTTKANGLNQ